MELLIKKIARPFRIHPVWSLLAVLLLLWWTAPFWLRRVDQTVGLVDSGVWMLVLLAIVAFILLTALSAFLLHSILATLGLPSVVAMVEHFRKLDLWQQMLLYWGSYALLLLAAIGCLMAIC